MEHQNLFTPIQLRGLELKNRVVFPGMGTFYTDDGGYVNDKFIAYHVARALGGNGLNTTEATSVHAPSAPRNFLNISDDKFLPGLKRFTDAIHEAGGKACVQLWQGGMLAKMMDPDVMGFVPSDITVDEIVGTRIPPMHLKAAETETIKEVIQAFGQAAKRAVEAGFDTMEYHLAHGYSPHSFLSSAFNKRTDEYGGSLENRARFPLECIREIRRNIPAEMPLLMRIDAHDDYLENGLTIEEIISFCKMAKEEGVDVLNISRGNPVTLGMKYEVPPIDLPRGFNVENAARIKRETGMVTIAVGRINAPDQAESILAEGKSDMVVMGRAQLADQDFCNKASAGDEESIVRCVGCNQGCSSYPMTCTRNPSVGREVEFPLPKTKQPKRVLVAGGGLAGLEAAITLKQRGHQPVVFEETNELGGQFLIAGLAPRKMEMREAALSRGRQAEKQGVELRLSSSVTPETLKEAAPEAVIIATGAQPIKLSTPGADLPHVCSSFEVLKGECILKGNVVIVGGGLVGSEAAEYVMESSADNHVTIVEMLEEVGKDLASARKMCVMESLEAAGIQTMVSTKCLEIKETSVIIERDGLKEELACDAVVIAVGSRSNDYSELQSYCEREGIPCYVIGDAKQARKAINAIAEAVEIARAI